jgi:hypothetical protein
MLYEEALSRLSSVINSCQYGNVTRVRVTVVGEASIGHTPAGTPVYLAPCYWPSIPPPAVLSGKN